ncbi:MAG: DNA gyrase subunit A, partial [Saprospiraceae bacterium]|nr:DNA gyrase subunit A [Saprospiraceae bacterium]
EVCRGISATVDNPEITIDELMEFIKAPDYPTGGIIYGTTGVREAFHTGRGRLVLRAKTEIETPATNRERIIVTEIPYQINKARLVAKIADLVNSDRVQGISDIRDESDRDGLRVVIEIKKDAMASVVLNTLFKHSDLQTSYGVNNVALVGGRPMTLNLKDIIEEFIDFRFEVIQKRTRFDLRKAEERAHILEGLLIALDNLDEVIALIRASSTVEEAKTGLMTTFQLSEIQAKAILDMRLQKLTGLEREKVKKEYDELMIVIDDLKDILASELRQRTIIKEELLEVEEKYGDERRTQIVAADGEISIEDLIKEEDVVITISQLGYIKRTPVSEYRTQGRGGRGSRGSKTRDSDFIEHMFVASTHNYLLLFTTSGQCHWLRVYEIPEAGKTSSGRVIQNILAIPKEDKIKAYIKIKDLTDREFLDSHYIVFATAQGMIKKTSVDAFSRPRSNGIIAINIKEGDSLLEAKLTTGHSQILLANRNGNAIRFEESRVRAMGRTAAGVRGMNLEGPNDAVIGMVCIDTQSDFGTILVISEKGNGKRTAVEEYRITNRGGKGVKTLQITNKTGQLVGLKYVYNEDDIMITTKSGITIRISAKDVSQLGRATQGVRMVRLDNQDEIADLAIVRYSEEEKNLMEEE